MYIFDLDGTIADLTHRRHLVENGNKKWDEFYAACVDDTPIQPIINLITSLNNTCHSIAILSGRSDIVKKETEEWLLKFGVPYDRLYMRPHGKYTPDQILKKEMYERLKADWEKFMHKEYSNHNYEFTVDMVFDDRDRVVRMWREMGLICCQVAEGNF